MNLKDLAEQAAEKNVGQQCAESTESDSNSSTDDEYPKYYEETPFLAVYAEDGDVVVRNEPQDVDIIFRQHNSGSDIKLWEVPDNVMEYWLTSSQFKMSAHNYEEEYDSELLTDLHESPEKALKRVTFQFGDGPSEPEKTCVVCQETLEDDDDYIILQSKRVHSHHTADEIADIVNLQTEKNITDSSGDDIRDVPDTQNRRWE